MVQALAPPLIYLNVCGTDEPHDTGNEAVQLALK